MLGRPVVLPARECTYILPAYLFLVQKQRAGDPAKFIAHGGEARCAGPAAGLEFGISGRTGGAEASPPPPLCVPNLLWREVDVMIPLSNCRRCLARAPLRRQPGAAK